MNLALRDPHREIPWHVDRLDPEQGFRAWHGAVGPGLGGVDGRARREGHRLPAARAAVISLQAARRFHTEPRVEQCGPPENAGTLGERACLTKGLSVLLTQPAGARPRVARWAPSSPIDQ